MALTLEVKSIPAVISLLTLVEHLYVTLCWALIIKWLSVSVYYVVSLLEMKDGS